jgi:hypothetical protein
MSTLIGAETGIKTITAAHIQCRSWVIRVIAIPGQNHSTIVGRGLFFSLVLACFDH